MKHLTNAQTRALHRVIEMAETWVRASPGVDPQMETAWEATLRDAKSAMQQVHIQQVYLRMQGRSADGPEPVKLVPVASGGQDGK